MTKIFNIKYYNNGYISSAQNCTSILRYNKKAT